MRPHLLFRTSRPISSGKSPRAAVCGSTNQANTGGFALVPVLLLLLVLGGLSASAAQLALLGDRSLRADQQQRVAMLAAQAALDDAARDILASTAPLRRAAFDSVAPTPDTSSTWPESACGDGALQGLCAAGTAWPGAPAEQLAQTAAFGSQSGATHPTGPRLPAQAPRYRIERLPQRPAADGGLQQVRIFQITALGFGPAPEPRAVTLQQIVRLPAPAVPTSSATP